MKKLLFFIFNFIVSIDVGIRFYIIKYKNTPTENPTLIATIIGASGAIAGSVIGCHRDTLSAGLDENIGTTSSNLHHQYNPVYTK